MKLSTKYIGGIGEDLTGSSTLFKIPGKDSLSVVIDYGLHQGTAGENKLNMMTDNEVLNADFIIITHAHMDHIGRLPMLIDKGFEGRIIMTSTTKELASLMLINNVNLTNDQIKQVDDLNKKKSNKLKGYLRLLAINKKLEENNLKKGEKWDLEKEKEKLLNGGDIKKILKESIDFLLSIDEDIDIARVLSRKQASDLLDINEKIIEIHEKREVRIDKNKYEFDTFLNTVIDLKREIDKGNKSEENYKKLEKAEYMISLYPIEIKNKLDEKAGIDNVISSEKRQLLLIQQNILTGISKRYNLEYGKSKSIEYKNEKKELEALTKKRDHIIGDKDLELCIKYSKKILGREDDFQVINTELPTLLYDVKAVYETLDKIETLEIGEEIELESRVVVSDLDSDVICRIPQIIKDGYSKKIYVNHKILPGISARWNKEYNEIVDHNKKNKELRREYETSTKFIYNYNRYKDRSKLSVPEGISVDDFYLKQVSILKKSEIFKFKQDIIDALDVYKSYLGKKDKYGFVKDKKEDYFNNLINEIENSIYDLSIIKRGNNKYTFDELLSFYYDNKDLFISFDEYLEIEKDFNKLNIKILSDIDNIEVFKKVNIKTVLGKITFIDNVDEIDEYINEELIVNLDVLDIEKIINSNGKTIFINKKLKSKLKRKIDKLIIERNANIDLKRKYKKDLIKKFEKYIFYLSNKDFFDGIFIGKDSIIDDLLELESVISELNEKKKIYIGHRDLFFEYLEFEKSKPYFDIHIDKLNKYNIKDLGDLDRVISEIYGNIKLSYTKKEIEHAKSRLEPVFEHSNQRTVEKVKLRFYEAGHVEGSVMVSVSIITKKVENILNNIAYKGANKKGFDKLSGSIKEYINLLFTGDIGKFKDPNLSGTPDVPDLKYDYVQFESTYATRNHPDKEKEFKKFIKELNTGYGNKLIPAFSFQRTQEIIVELLQNKFENFDLIKNYYSLTKKLKQLNKEYGYLFKKDEDELSNEKRLLKNDKYNEKGEIERELLYIEENVFLGTIIVDAPLAIDIGKVFLGKFPEKYKFLNSEYQKEVLGREVVKILGQGDYKNLYKTGGKNNVIISSGGMMQGGAIINHAKEIISDKDSKILFTGYQAENTLGGKISRGKKDVIIDGDSYDVNAEIHSIGGYSSHIERDDIIDLLTKKLKLSKNAVLASTHGTSDRIKLVKAIHEVNEKLNIIIPEVGDKVNIDL